jgi:hypothetical protein
MSLVFAIEIAIRLHADRTRFVGLDEKVTSGG